MKYALVKRIGCAALFLAALVINPLPSLAQNSTAFGFDITLSPKAAQTLAASGEGITIGASFYGVPNKRGEKHANEIGNIDLGYEQIDMPGEESAVRVTGRTIDEIFEAGLHQFLLAFIARNREVASAIAEQYRFTA